MLAAFPGFLVHIPKARRTMSSGNLQEVIEMLLEDSVRLAEAEFVGTQQIVVA